MNAIATAILLVGTGFLVIAAAGVLRLPDLYTRMHAVTKGGTVGVGFSLLALVLFEPSFSVFTQAAGIILFVLLTAPVAAHIIGRAAYLAGVDTWKGTVVDELGPGGPDDRRPPSTDAAD